MRVLHWAPQFGSETGTGKAIKGWLEASAASQVDVTVVSGPLGRESGVRFAVLSKKSLAKQLAVFWHQIRLTNVVHLHGAFDLKLSAAYVLIGIEKFRRMFTGDLLAVVLTPHGALCEQVFRRSVLKKWLYWHLIERPLTKLVNHAICTTPVEATDLQVLMPHVKTDVVPLVISGNDSPAVGLPRPSSKDIAHVPLICTLGRYDIGMKGLDILIAAVVKLNAEGYPIRMRCIGYDREHGIRVLSDYVKSVNAEKFVECTGPKYGNEKDLAVASCDVFCMPSRYESFSFALIEGLESGLPVLVGSGACLTSYFDAEQERTMVVAPEADAWSESIKRLLADPDSNLQSAHRALRNLHKNCALSVVGKSLETAYRGMVARTATAWSGGSSKTCPPL